MAMRPLTAIEVAATAAERFRRQYADWSDDDRFADGKSKGDVNLVFNTQQHTPENVAKALNDGWAYPQCSCCGENVSVVVAFKEDWNEDEYRLCHRCLSQATSMIGQFPNA